MIEGFRDFLRGPRRFDHWLFLTFRACRSLFREPRPKMSSPPAPLRQMLHGNARRFMFLSLAASIGSSAALYFGYVHPRHLKYEEYFATYDPYVRMREICAANKGYLHTCPHELAKLYEEKGKPIAPLQ
uniref:COX6C domain-containing protein n=1 Tax=Panagrellus redivivus TaxID=6233 RepID=A0A7E5A1X5_PANRE